MSSLSEAYLDGTRRVTLRIFYFIPLAIGQKELTLKPEMIGGKPTVIRHRGILDEFVHQVDDISDLQDARHKKIFAELAARNNGVIALENPKLRMEIMQEHTPNKPVPEFLPVFIPTMNDLGNPGMADEVTAFKTMVPFPAVRKFIRFWQESIEGPLKEIQISSTPVESASWSQRAEYRLH